MRALARPQAREVDYVIKLSLTWAIVYYDILGPVDIHLDAISVAARYHDAV